MPSDRLPEDAARRLTWPLRLTWAGMAAERLLRAFWPLITLVMAAGAALVAGLGGRLPGGWLQGAALAVLALGLLLFARGAMRLRWPGRAAAQARLDATLPGQPIAALSDDQAVGTGDEASRAVWAVHRQRMQDRLKGVRPAAPDLRLSDRDPYALRYIALLALVMAAGFGTLARLADVAGVLPGTPAQAAVTASWEGWIEPPAYTGKPSLYLNDQPEGALSVPVGSRLTVRFYGQSGVLGLSESVSAEPLPDTPQPTYAFDVDRNGNLSVTGPGGRDWQVVALADQAPAIAADGALTRTLMGDLKQPFVASDDYGIAGGEAVLTLDLADVERRYGLAIEPEPRDPVVLDLPMPFRGDRTEIAEVFTDNLAKHPWATLPVSLTLSVIDEAGQEGRAEPVTLVLPGRRFLDPLSQAIVEQRRDLLWNRLNGARVARMLRAVSNRPDGLFDHESDYLRLRILVGRLERGIALGDLPDELVDQIAEGLWQIATGIEDGNLSDARERMRRAQERLAEAMRQGASPEELAELMDELRQAMDDYMRQLAQDPAQPNADQPDQGDTMEMTRQDLEELMDQIQDLMEQGRTDEAMAMLQALEQMMENMEVRQGQQQGDGQSPGEQAMNGLQDSLRQQQGLSDQAFRDLQEGRNSGAQAGESQGNEGRDGGQGRGQSHDGQQGQGQGSEGQGGGDQQGTQQGQAGQDGPDLSERQRALAEELERQRNALPGAGSEAGERARDALDRAGRAMDGAADDLAQGDLSGALDNQADAMEALREGMRNLEEAMRDQQRAQQGQQGTARGQDGDRRSANDPLGRGPNADSGGLATEAPLAEGEDPYRRAEELMDELRRRSGETERPQAERDYYGRLLEQF